MEPDGESTNAYMNIDPEERGAVGHPSIHLGVETRNIDMICELVMASDRRIAVEHLPALLRLASSDHRLDTFLQTFGEADAFLELTNVNFDAIHRDFKVWRT